MKIEVIKIQPDKTKNKKPHVKCFCSCIDMQGNAIPPTIFVEYSDGKILELETYLD